MVRTFMTIGAVEVEKLGEIELLLFRRSEGYVGFWLIFPFADKEGTEVPVRSN